MRSPSSGYSFSIRRILTLFICCLVLASMVACLEDSRRGNLIRDAEFTLRVNSGTLHEVQEVKLRVEGVRLHREIEDEDDDDNDDEDNGNDNENDNGEDNDNGEENGDDDVFAQDDEVILEEPIDLNLMELTRGDSQLLFSAEEVNPGEYDAIELIISDGACDNTLMDAQGQEHCITPLDGEDGKLLSNDIFLGQGTISRWTMDIDLRKILYKPEEEEEDYRIGGPVRVVQSSLTGGLEGALDVTELESGECEYPAVYLYRDDATEEDDFFKGSEGSEFPPFASGMIARQEEPNPDEYDIHGLPSRSFLAALTCEADKDQPGEENELEFINSTLVRISANDTVIQDFPAEEEDDDDDDNGDDDNGDNDD